MLNIAVVDDEDTSLNKICRLINESLMVEKSIYTFNSSVDFFSNINNLNYDLVFLDIEIPEISGFQLAESIRATLPNSTIIFVSNMEHLVFESFKFQPFRFVKKESMEKDMKEAIQAYKEKSNKLNEIFLFYSNDISMSVVVSDILYFESLGHDIYVKTLSDYYKLKRDSQNIKKLCEQFEKKGFIRIHKSYLVNYKYIFLINRDDVVLKTNERIRINPHNVNEIKKIYQKRIMKENGLLSKGQLVEVGRGDLVGKYVGWTAKTVQAKFKEAIGGVIFIDEA